MLTANQCKDVRIRVMGSHLYEMIKSPVAGLSRSLLVNKMS